MIKYFDELFKSFVIGLLTIYIFNVLMQGIYLNIALNPVNILLIGFFRVFGFIIVLFFAL